MDWSIAAPSPAAVARSPFAADPIRKDANGRQSPTVATVDIDGIDESPNVRAPLRLLVIDRRSLTLECLVAALADTREIGSIVAASNESDALTRIGDHGGADVALLNLAGDPFDERSVALMREVLDPVLPPGAIVLLTGLVDRVHMLAALKQGVLGFLSSDTPTDIILEALRLVSRGWTVYPPLDPKLLAPDTRESGSFPGLAEGLTLTSRQRQVLQNLQRGMTNRDIANGLGISERAVKGHVQELMRRMGATNRTQIVAMLAGMTNRPRDEESD
ncbi:response regulator transcription factor [Sphingomonas sp. SUN019]|uniref:response regulator transcription factor n=1 Tax=Sphingomonas sp. SUN019 TaxID=2937788 RepID=UPI0021649262|nr:response regulator transcription factor [Sphingomonas sp. SUN019]UVO51673.1 response regulator transcription factor [Sphingomonas sp. SUN019]